jgi:hypothetical protein
VVDRQAERQHALDGVGGRAAGEQNSCRGGRCGGQPTAGGRAHQLEETRERHELARGEVGTRPTAGFRDRGVHRRNVAYVDHRHAARDPYRTPPAQAVARQDRGLAEVRIMLAPNHPRPRDHDRRARLPEVLRDALRLDLGARARDLRVAERRVRPQRPIGRS